MYVCALALPVSGCAPTGKGRCSWGLLPHALVVRGMSGLLYPPPLSASPLLRPRAQLFLDQAVWNTLTWVRFIPSYAFEDVKALEEHFKIFFS